MYKIFNLFVLYFVVVSLAMEDSGNSIGDQPSQFLLLNFLKQLVKQVPKDNEIIINNTTIESYIEGLEKEVRINKSGCPEGRRPRRLQLEDFDSQEMKRSRGLNVGQEEEECIEDIEEENINQGGDVEKDKTEENFTNFDDAVDESNGVPSVSKDETAKLFVATTTEPFTNAIAEVTIEKIFEGDADSENSSKIINDIFDLNATSTNQNLTQSLVENSSIEQETSTSPDIKVTTDKTIKVEVTTVQTVTGSEQETSTSTRRKATTEEITELEVTTIQALTQDEKDTDELTKITVNKPETSTTPSRKVTADEITEFEETKIEAVTESQKENSTMQNINGEVKDDVIKVQPAANSQPENSSLEINDIINDVFKINITTNEIVKVDTESESQQENPTSVEKVQIDITTVQSLIDNHQENITNSQKNSTSPDINETTESTISTSTTKSTDGENDIPEIILSVITETVPSELTTTKTIESSLGETPATPDVGTTSSPITGSSSKNTTTFEEVTLAEDETTVTTAMEETSERITFSTEVTVKTTTEKPMPVDKTTEKTTEPTDEIPMKTTISIDETTVPADEISMKTTLSIDETTEPDDEISTKTTVSKDETTAPTKTTVSIDEKTESITTETTRKVPLSLSETSTESETFTEYDTSPDHRMEPVFPDTKPSPVSTSPPAPGRSATQWQHQLIGSLVVLVAVLAAVFIVVKVARKNRAVSGSYKPQKREMALEEFKVEMDLYRDNYPKGERLI